MSHPNGLRDRVEEQLRDAAADAEQIAEIKDRVRELEAALVDRGLSFIVAVPTITVLNPAARGAGGQTGAHPPPTHDPAKKGRRLPTRSEAPVRPPNTTSPTTTRVNILTHSPDGEPRGILYRAGDLFPMDPRQHQRTAIDETASQARPWGLRYLQLPQIRAGKHESDTSKHTTGGGGDSKNPEDSGTD